MSTPTTEQVRHQVTHLSHNVMRLGYINEAEFDRWLAAEKAKWQAEERERERERVAVAIEALTDVYPPGYFGTQPSGLIRRDRAARIARQGGTDATL